jgi:hypothetical protein
MDALVFARLKPVQKEVFEAECDLEGWIPTGLLRHFILQKNYECEEKYGKKLQDRIKAREKIRKRLAKSAPPPKKGFKF